MTAPPPDQDPPTPAPSLGIPQEQLKTLASTKPWYRAQIGPRLKPSVKEFYKNYVGLEGDELVEHLYTIRDRAWPLGEYPCVGQWQWLWSILPTFPAYPTILARVRAGGTVLDLGCCFGQELRYLAVAGAPTENMIGSDIHGELWEVGHALYGDRETMKARFVQADVLDEGEGSGLEQLKGKVDVIIVCQVLHIFGGEEQVRICKRIVGMTRGPGAMVVGYQLGQREWLEYKTQWGTMCFHNAETFREMWRRVGEETGTEWKVDVKEGHLSGWGAEPEDYAWMGPTITALNFTITREK